MSCCVSVYGRQTLFILLPSLMVKVVSGIMGWTLSFGTVVRSGVFGSWTSGSETRSDVLESVV